VDDKNTNWIHLPDRSPLKSAKNYLPTPISHFGEFAEAIRSHSATMSNFPDVASPFAETLLWGSLAVWAGRKIEREEIDLAAGGSGDLAEAVRPTYRNGYEL